MPKKIIKKKIRKKIRKKVLKKKESDKPKEKKITIQTPERQKLLLKTISDNIRNGMSMGEAMRSVGYSETYSKTPSMLTATDAWKKLVEKHLSDENLTKVHGELLKSKQLGYFVFPKEMKDKDIIEHVKASGIDVIVIRETDKGKMAFYSLSNAQAVAKGLDMAYKMKNKYGESIVRHKFGELSDEELAEKLAREISDNLGLEEGDNQKKNK